MKRIITKIKYIIGGIIFAIVSFFQKTILAANIDVQPMYGVPDPAPTTIWTIILTILKFILIPIVLLIGLIVLIYKLISKRNK